MTTEKLKFPRTYADLERNHFENAPYIHAVWKLTKYKWGEGVQLPFNVYYFPKNQKMKTGIYLVIVKTITMDTWEVNGMAPH